MLVRGGPCDLFLFFIYLFTQQNRHWYTIFSRRAKGHKLINKYVNGHQQTTTS